MANLLQGVERRAGSSDVDSSIEIWMNGPRARELIGLDNNSGYSIQLHINISSD